MWPKQQPDRPISWVELRQMVAETDENIRKDRLKNQTQHTHMEQRQYDNTNKGTLWMEARTFTKRDGSEGTSFSGSINVDGKEFFLDAYPRTVTMKDGTSKDVLDLKVKPKQPRPDPSNNTLMQDGSVVPF